VHIGDYEDEIHQKKLNLDDLVEAVLQRTTIPRIRLSSLEPIEISERLLNLYRTNDRLCAHFHLSIQSADTDVLREMKRKYSQSDIAQSLNQISQIKNVFVGMDVIAGFPTETDEQFENTFKFLSETPWTRLHVFPYSERSGTRAASLPQRPFHLRKERAARLRDLSLHRFQSEALKQIGLVHKTLILHKPSKGAYGLTRNYWPVRLNWSLEKLESLRNQEVEVLITDLDFSTGEGQLIGQ
jgi:threonylcarbamoyladenosine tRNA methylthiotransferase MtaB